MALPRVFFDISMDGNSTGRIVMEVSGAKREMHVICLMHYYLLFRRMR